MVLPPGARAVTTGDTVMCLKMASHDVAAGGSRPMGAEWRAMVECSQHPVEPLIAPNFVADALRLPRSDSAECGIVIRVTSALCDVNGGLLEVCYER